MTTVPEEAVNTAEIIQVITDLRMAILQDDDEGLAEHAEPMAKAKALISRLSALPHLPGVGVKKLEWELVSGDHYAEGAGIHYNIYETGPDWWNCVTVKPGNVRLATNVCLEVAKAAAQADYEARILSAIETVNPVSQPSAERELALEVIKSELSGNTGELIDMMASAIRADGSDLCDGAWESLSDDRKLAWRGDAERALAAVREYLTTRALSSPDHADAGKVEGDGSAAARNVLAERRRQIEAEGWTPEHDDHHKTGELAKAATCYASVYPLAASYWPWDLKWWKPSDRRRNLVKAGALILAEIERLDRLPSAPSQEVAGS